MTEDPNTPKALLPVANKPMIYYQLQWLEDAHITGKHHLRHSNKKKRRKELRCCNRWLWH
jgi:dTDP-glucose pyrophosphorylase